VNGSPVSNPGDPERKLTVDNKQLTKFSQLMLKLEAIDNLCQLPFVSR